MQYIKFCDTKTRKKEKIEKKNELNEDIIIIVI